ncbi:TetR/AcrR family transcriptional regulator [Gorillibacterium massiliense]|uniref:TetR/AcrR family transcriptional regulator n=1 Tax=Gorillibacterium massiliense TaxID=1280390 RepID=UPI0004B0B2AA|nr:TetR/AcrR family transcriptional regulator [Gorillibacterium massiliense]
MKDLKQGKTTGEQSAGTDEEKSSTRRRGDILENAILQAAWDELGEAGYSNFTMERVAARAKTNKNAIYRRWSNKPLLVIAALSKHVPKPSLETPDTGDLREDLLTLLQKIVTPMQLIGAETFHGLLVDHLGKDLLSSLPKIMSLRNDNILTSGMKRILQNAEKRGEISFKSIPDRVIALPVELIMHEILATFEPISEQTVTEIVDVIFLPLVLAHN